MMVLQKSMLRLIHTSSKAVRKTHFSAKYIDENIKTYQEDGVVCLRKVFDKKWLDVVAKGISTNLQQPSKYSDRLVDENGKGLFFNDYYNYKKIPEYYEYITSSPAAEIAGRLMKSTKSILFHEHIFFKEHGSSKETPWHHDFAYYPLTGFQNCSIWMPTTHVRKQFAVKFIKGSHLWNRYFIPIKFESHENYPIDGILPDHVTDIRSYLDDVKQDDIVQYELEPGDCVAFHMRCVHGTEKSNNPENRSVMVTRWLGDDIKFAQRPWQTSPPGELLPPDLKLGDKLVDNKSFLVPWRI